MNICIYFYSQFRKIDDGWKCNDIERLQDGQKTSSAARNLLSFGSNIARF